MYSCSECSDLLLDFLYGLLEPEEVQRLRAHLADCPACRGTLAEAEAQQRLLARAARVAREVPAFVAPSDSVAPEASAPAEAATSAAVPIAPETLPRPRPRGRIFWRWAWLATAAAVLLVAGGLYWSYEDGLTRRHAELAQAKHEVDAVDARLASSARTFEDELAQLPSQVRERELRLQVAGPALYQADAPAQIRVLTQGATGQPRAADLDVKVIDSTGKKALLEQKVKTTGETAVALPAALAIQPGTAVQLVVKAAAERGGEAQLSDVLSTMGPSYDTQVVFNKPTYRVGDVLSFRTLTLDRFSQKPPGRELPLTFTLRDGPKVVRQLSGKARADGIAGGEFPLGGLPAGTDYSLEVTSAPDGNAGLVRSRSRRFAILADGMDSYANLAPNNSQTNQVNFDRNAYAPGDTVGGVFQQTQNAPAGQSIMINARQGNGQTIPLEGAPPGKPLNTITDAQGRARFNLRLPREMSPGRPMVEVELKDGTTNSRVQQDIPVAASYPEVEFFPEGGDLIAGVPNRVYFRAQTPQGVPIDVQGQVVDRAGKAITSVKSRRDGSPALRGLGDFTFTPQVGESYTFQVDVSAQTKKVLPMPPVHRAGIALNVPKSVVPEGEPITAVVRTTEPVPQLLGLATCRGHVVDQVFFASAGKDTTIRLNPVSGTRGIVRLTIYEIRQHDLLPRAERLVFRTPAERLIVSRADGNRNQKKTYRGGEHVELGVQVKNEKGEPAEATLLAAAVNDTVLPSSLPEQGPPAFFYLTSDIRDGADLENADFLVSDTPPARAALDLFLGTQGWRRFTVADDVAGLDNALASGVRQMERPAVFNHDNSEEVAARSAQLLAARQENLRRKAVQERVALQEDRDRRVQTVRSAAATLHDYEELPQRTARLALGVLVLLLLAAGGVLLVIGFVRVVLGRRPTAAFGAAFASLVLCLVLYGATSKWREQSDARADAGWALADQRPPQRRPQAPRPLSDVREAEAVKRSAPVGRFREAPEQPGVPTLDAASNGAKSRARGLAQDGLRRAGQEQLSKGAMQQQFMKKAMSPPAGAGGFGGSQPNSASPPPPPGPAGAATAARAARAAQDKASDQAADQARQQAPASTPATVNQPNSVQELRTYAYRNTANRGLVAPDILLWYPALNAADGTARINFDVPDQSASYRLLLYANSPSGRLGVYRGQIVTHK